MTLIDPADCDHPRLTYTVTEVTEYPVGKTYENEDGLTFEIDFGDGYTLDQYNPSVTCSECYAELKGDII